MSLLIARQYKFLESVRDFKTIQFLNAMSQLAHMDTGLAEHTWYESIFIKEINFLFMKHLHATIYFS